MLHKFCLSLASAAAALALMAGTAQANLLTNGDFATGDLTGWDSTGFAFVAISDSILPGTPEIALIGVGNLSGVSSISQDFTVPTATHWLTVSFDYGFGGIAAAGADLFEAFVDISGFGNTTLLAIFSDGLFLETGTVTMMFEVTGADPISPNATISFVIDESDARFSGFSGAGVDNVVVEAVVHVPEPGTLALFGLGLAGLGFARRRKAA